MTELFCSFCGKKESQVQQLIAGGGKQPRGELPAVHICDECIRLSYSILESTPRPTEPPVWRAFREGGEDFEWTTLPQKDGVMLLVRRLGREVPIGAMHAHDAKLNVRDARQLLHLLGDCLP